ENGERAVARNRVAGHQLLSPMSEKYESARPVRAVGNHRTASASSCYRSRTPTLRHPPVAQSCREERVLRCPKWRAKPPPDPPDAIAEPFQRPQRLPATSLRAYRDPPVAWRESLRHSAQPCPRFAYRAPAPLR